MNVINPAYAGALGKNVFAFTPRRQWSSMQDAPSTLAFSYSSERENPPLEMNEYLKYWLG
jgi:hypothetical protein